MVCGFPIGAVCFHVLFILTSLRKCFWCNLLFAEKLGTIDFVTKNGEICFQTLKVLFSMIADCIDISNRLETLSASADHVSCFFFLHHVMMHQPTDSQRAEPVVFQVGTGDGVS